MKYFSKLNQYKASNLILDMNTLTATSYGWWEFVKPIGSKIVFNNYRYSVTTSCQQSKMRSLLRELGIKIDLEIQAPRGLQELSSAIPYLEREIETLENELKNPRIRKIDERKIKIGALTSELTAVRALIKLEMRAA